MERRRRFWVFGVAVGLAGSLAAGAVFEGKTIYNHLGKTSAKAGAPFACADIGGSTVEATPNEIDNLLLAEQAQATTQEHEGVQPVGIGAIACTEVVGGQTHYRLNTEGQQLLQEKHGTTPHPTTATTSTG